MARKELGALHGRVQDGAVELTGFKTTPAFEAKGRQRRFASIRVYRAAADGFVFGQDYAEYFDGMDWGKARLIHEGPLPAGNERKYSYRDESVKVGRTYAYWMAAASGKPSGPVAVRVRDPEVWWSADELERRLRDLKTSHRGMVRILRVGETGMGRPIPGFIAGDGRACIALVGAVHAGEAGAELMVWAVDRLLDTEPALFSRARVVCVPVVNLDERERLARGCPWYLRVNARGVDLNRNFPADWETVEHGYGYESDDPESMTYRGPQAASEPETQALMTLLRAQRPVAVYAFHCLASICGGMFLGAGAARGDREYEKRCRAAALPYGKALTPEVPPEELVRYGCTSGSLAAWCYRVLGIPAFDLEMSRHEPRALAACRADRTNRALLKDYRERHVAGLRAALRTAGRG